MRKATLRITVTERGNLESCVTVDGICEVNANQIKIISLVPEGTKVKKGDVVCKFDSSEIDKNIAQQDIKVKQASRQDRDHPAGAGNSAQQGRERHHRRQGRADAGQARPGEVPEGRLPGRDHQATGARSGSRKKTSKRPRTSSISTRQLMKKGFKSPEQVATFKKPTSPRPSSSTKAPSSSSRSSRNTTTRRRRPSSASKADQAQKKIEQAVATLKAQMSKATSENESAKATADIEQQQFKEYLKQKDKTIIRAGQDGDRRLCQRRAGTTRAARSAKARPSTRSRRSSRLPDMTKMQVKVNIHESLIKKIKVGQKAEIRIESFPNIVFVGTVTSVSQLADSTRPWMTGGVKQYPTIVKLDDLKAQELKPGMTAEAKVLVGELDNVLVVPVQAVAEHKGEFFAFVANGRPDQASESEDRREQRDPRPDPRRAGRGRQVALDARLRAAAEFKLDDDKKGIDEPKPKDQAARDRRRHAGRKP